jgi:hypothetical protein
MTTLHNATAVRFMRAFGHTTALVFASSYRAEHSVQIINASTNYPIAFITTTTDGFVIKQYDTNEFTFCLTEQEVVSHCKTLTHYPRRASNRRGYGKVVLREQYRDAYGMSF